LPLFWDFSAEADKFEIKFQEKFKSKMEFLIFETRTYKENINNKQLIKIFECDEEFNVLRDNDIEPKTFLTKLMENAKNCKLINSEDEDQFLNKIQEIKD